MSVAAEEVRTTGTRRKESPHTGLALLATIFGLVPMGMVSAWYASEVIRLGGGEDSAGASRRALWWGALAFPAQVVLVLVIAGVIVLNLRGA